MIHIEGNWYISVGGYKNYTLGTYKKTTIVDREVELLENATYHSSLEKALQAYVEMSVSNLLKSHDLELMDALAVMRNEYARLTNVFQKVFAEPQIVYISLPQGTMPKLGMENALSDQSDKMSEL